jgi:hypothetical protein
MQKLLLSYRDNLRVEVEPGIPVAARTVAELRALSTWPGRFATSSIDAPLVEDCCSRKILAFFDFNLPGAEA